MAPHLPRSIAEWERAARYSEVATTPIHSFTSPRSGSEITRAQFLTCRVLFLQTLPIAQPSIVEGELKPGHVKSAAEKLSKDADFQSYLKSIRDKQETVAKGRWAMARSLQYDCSLSVIGQTPASTATPEEPRRSSRLASKGSAESAARTAALVDWSGSNASESSYGASHDKGRVEDETTISAALHAFAHGFCIFDFGAKGRWTLKRQPFHICDASRSGRRVCESRVDGFYRSESAVIKAIIEVKPFRRTDDTDIQISMQEGSQVASWISESPPPKRDTRRYGPYKRLLVSQDRDDIYFTLCTFSNEYVQYITGRMDNRQMAASRGRPEGFLKMQRQGPYNVQNYQKMEMAGKNILAFCMQGGLD